ncbi:zinc uptake transcriptional repressor Zur [Vibrio sp. ZSDZ34]|uniref:Ferric uptake regulation protein n=1 Tax=Vibrio gelatinilyticus TaxID=2893468 RepID=A0A9X2AWV1_9VIBR|nr:zinc uptake transcriptional repressor Zur [Vibrio gelatinilyticus]MCJ2378354.1 zinc uptake transcriptional repressor Zur [Vibrio gelatinilyticus]
MNKQLTQQIEDICVARGVRLTAQRRRVYEIICENRRACSAYELLEQLKQSEPQAKPPTVYRALDFLLEQGFIHRVESTNSFISCCTFGEHKHFSHLLICESCGSVVELQDDNLIALLNRNVEKHGFEFSSHIIESHGICKACSSSAT